MASGDIVSGIGTVGALLDFQPTVGVEIVITTAFGKPTATESPGFFDGTNFSGTESSSTALKFDNIKMMITNALWLRIPLRGSRFQSFSGMEL